MKRLNRWLGNVLFTAFGLIVASGFVHSVVTEISRIHIHFH